MKASVQNYTWDYGTDQEFPGVKSTSSWSNLYQFLPKNDLYDVAVALADIIDRKNNNA